MGHQVNYGGLSQGVDAPGQHVWDDLFDDVRMRHNKSDPETGNAEYLGHGIQYDDVGQC